MKVKYPCLGKINCKTGFEVSSKDVVGSKRTNTLNTVNMAYESNINSERDSSLASVLCSVIRCEDACIIANIYFRLVFLALQSHRVCATERYAAAPPPLKDQIFEIL